MLRESGDNALDAVVSSTLSRALQTAELCMLERRKHSSSPLVALSKMVEIQCDDIWNEPRAQAAVERDWPEWSVQGEPVSEMDTAQSMIQRAEEVWKEILAMPGKVIGVSAHGCFLFFFSRRLAAAQKKRLPSFRVDKFSNAEIRRQELPGFDGEMSWSDMSSYLDSNDFEFYNRYHKRASFVNLMRERGSLPFWTLQEWRWARSDAEIDQELDLVVKYQPQNFVQRIFCAPCCARPMKVK